VTRRTRGSTSALVEEALGDTQEVDVEGEPASIFSAEHLAAIALQTGRAKDKARLAQFAEAGVLDADRLADILSRHGLTEKWRRLEPLLREDTP
jgi:hypothetical protein